MLDVNDYKLVPLDALVHDEALFQSYKDFIEAVGQIYAIEDLFVCGEIDLGDDYGWEHHVLDSEVRFWNSKHYSKTAENFLRWTHFDMGYWPERETKDVYALNMHVLVKAGTRTVLGRSQLYSGLDRGVWTGMGFDCIHPDYREEGLGRVILAHRLNLAREIGIEEFRTNVKKENAASLRRVDKFNALGLTYNHKYLRDNNIAWVKPTFTLDEAYEILCAKGAPEASLAPEL